MILSFVISSLIRYLRYKIQCRMEPITAYWTHLESLLINVSGWPGSGRIYIVNGVNMGFVIFIDMKFVRGNYHSSSLGLSKDRARWAS